VSVPGWGLGGTTVLVLLVLFGSVTAMLMPILTALIAIAAGVSVNALVSHRDRTQLVVIAYQTGLVRPRPQSAHRQDPNQ
jgi:uncharacterized membrane protein